MDTSWWGFCFAVVVLVGVTVARLHQGGKRP